LWSIQHNDAKDESDQNGLSMRTDEKNSSAEAIDCPCLLAAGLWNSTATFGGQAALRRADQLGKAAILGLRLMPRPL